MSRSRFQDVQELLGTAWPLMLSTGMFSITLFVDRLFLYLYSDSAAAAAMSAGTLFWSVTCLPAGICGYTSTFVAQYLGIKRLDRALHVVWQGILLAASIVPLLCVLGWMSYRIFRWSGHSHELAQFEYEFFFWLVPGACATIISSALVGLFAGSGRPIVLLYCDVAATACNVLLDYALIFGNLGCPRWGVAGAAIASSISLTAKLLLLLFFAWRYLQRDVFGPWNVGGVARESDSLSNRAPGEPAVPLLQRIGPLMRFDAPLMKRLFQYGWPAGVSVVAEAWSFTIIMMIVGKLGERPAAATTLALGVNVLAFIPLIGLGIAVGVLVGKYLVQNQIATAKRVVESALIIGVLYSAFFVVFYGGFPDLVMNVYAIGNDPERFEAMRPELRPLLGFIAAYCVFDALQVIFAGALKGAGDTLMVLGGHLVAGFGTVGAAVLGHWLFGWDGLYYWWSVITVWVILLAAIFTTRYFQGGWLKKRVIEPDLIHTEDVDSAEASA
ncbi:MAG: MATE family efflux transporter [Pirellula sp.]